MNRISIPALIIVSGLSSAQAGVMAVCPDLSGQYKCVQNVKDQPDKQFFMTIAQNQKSYVISESIDARRFLIAPVQGVVSTKIFTQALTADCPKSDQDAGVVLRLRSLTADNAYVEQTFKPNKNGFVHRIERALSTADLVGPKIIRSCERVR